MKKLDWLKADEKLSKIIRVHSRVDVYVVLNIIAPLRLRLHNGERTLRLYNQIMNIRLGTSRENKNPGRTPGISRIKQRNLTGV